MYFVFIYSFTNSIMDKFSSFFCSIKQSSSQSDLTKFDKHFYKTGIIGARHKICHPILRRYPINEYLKGSFLPWKNFHIFLILMFNVLVVYFVRPSVICFIHHFTFRFWKSWKVNFAVRNSVYCINHSLNFVCQICILQASKQLNKYVDTFEIINFE